jgi:hypothetical protein
MSRRARSLSSLALLSALVAAPFGCAELPPPKSAPPAAAKVAPRFFRGGEYLVRSTTFLERDGDRKRALAGGVRVVLEGERVLWSSDGDVLEGGIPMPSWVKGDVRYLFWSNRELFASSTFDGPLRPLARGLQVQRADPWLDGVMVYTSGGALVLRGDGTRADPPLAGIVRAEALGPRDGVVIHALGRIRQTSDGGATFVDRSRAFPEAAGVDVRGAHFEVYLGGVSRFLSATGEVSELLPNVVPRRDAEPPAPPTPWTDAGHHSLGEALVEGGIVLDDGRLLAIDEHGVAAVSPKTFEVSDVRAFPARYSSCAGIRLREGPFAVCETNDTAVVLDLRGAPRVERSFELGPERSLDRFVGVDGEALAFVGSCTRSLEPPTPRDDGPRRYDADENHSTQRSPKLCVRGPGGRWVERSAPASDAADLVAWIPEGSGDATALVARRRKRALEEPARSTEGGVTLARVPARHPLLRFPSYGRFGARLLVRQLWLGEGGAVEGWFPTDDQVGLQPASLDRDGVVRLRSLPSRATNVEGVAGPLALVVDHLGRTFETLDAGRTWTETARLPGGHSWGNGCTPTGCSRGLYQRLGWGRPLSPSERPTDEALEEQQHRQRNRHQRSPALEGLATAGQLRCSVAGPAAGERVTDNYWNMFGAAKGPPMRGQAMRLGTLGVMQVPWQYGRGTQTLSGDLELGWLELFDLGATVHRLAVPSSQVDPQQLRRRGELPLGYVLTPSGRVDPIATGSADACLAPLLDAAGITRPIGGCVPESRAWSQFVPTVGVEVGQHLLLLSHTGRTLEVSRVEGSSGPPRSKGAPAPKKPEREAGKKPASAPATPAQGPAALAVPGQPPPFVSSASRLEVLPLVGRAPRLTKVRSHDLLSGNITYAVGAGVRGREAFVVLLEATGRASYAPVDLETGELAEDSALASLSGLRVGTDARCAPRPDDVRVIVPITREISLARDSLAGLVQTGTWGLATLRWSKDRACLDALELSVRDERYEADHVPLYEQAGQVRKLIARFDAQAARAPGGKPGEGAGALVLVMPGLEVRQPLTCR